MGNAELSRSIRLSVPAGRGHSLVAGMALSALGMLAGLDVDLLGDLRTVTDECIDCLTHQPGKPQEIELEAAVADGKLTFAFQAERRVFGGEADQLELEITRGVLETLMPEVRLQSDEGGVARIECAMAV